MVVENWGRTRRFVTGTINISSYARLTIFPSFITKLIFRSDSMSSIGLTRHGDDVRRQAEGYKAGPSSDARQEPGFTNGRGAGHWYDRFLDGPRR